jgi:hypothetical protein
MPISVRAHDGGPFIHRTITVCRIPGSDRDHDPLVASDITVRAAQTFRFRFVDPEVL